MAVIAFVANSAWNISNFRLPLMDALRNEGHDILGIAPIDRGVKDLDELGYRHIKLKHLRRKGTNPIKDYRLVQELRSIYRRENIDLALQFTIKPNIYGSIAAKGLRTRTISNVTGLGYTFLSSGVSAKIARHLYRKAFSVCDRVVFQNTDDRAEFARLGLYAPEKAVIIPGSGVDIEYFSPRAEPSGDIMQFLFAGRLLLHKGIKEFLEAAKILLARYPEWKFTIAGARDQGNPASIPAIDLYRYTDKYANIEYLGPVTDIREPLTQANVLVLPSYREGMSRTILEAMSIGRPVIASDVPGCRDCVIHGHNGWLVRPRYVNGLVEAMEEAYKAGPGKRKKLGKNGRERAVYEFSTEIVIEAYRREIDNLLGK